MIRFRSRPTVAAWAGGVLAIAGFYAIVLSWRGAASTPSLALQMPYLLSGAFAGLGLVVFAVALVHLDTTRRLAAEEDAALREIVASATRATVALRTNTGTHTGER